MHTETKYLIVPRRQPQSRIDILAREKKMIETAIKLAEDRVVIKLAIKYLENRGR